MNINIRTSAARGLALTTLLALAAAAPAAEYGNIKGRFVFEGTPKVEPISVSKDPEFCGKHELNVETISVGDKNGLQNVFVYLYTARGKKIDVNPELKPAAEPKMLDNKGCRFEPHAMTLWTEEELKIHNSDAGIGHNTNAMKLVANPSFNQTIPNDAPLIKKFAKSEPIPTQVSCSIHPWMNAVVLIRDNPYMAVSGKDGSFEIKGVPAGKHPFVFWHEGKGNLKTLKVGKDKADRKGQVELEVPAGETLDLGDITVPSALVGK